MKGAQAVITFIQRLQLFGHFNEAPTIILYAKWHKILVLANGMMTLFYLFSSLIDNIFGLRGGGNLFLIYYKKMHAICEGIYI